MNMIHRNDDHFISFHFKQTQQLLAAKGQHGFAQVVSHTLVQREGTEKRQRRSELFELQVQIGRYPKVKCIPG